MPDYIKYNDAAGKQGDISKSTFSRSSYDGGTIPNAYGPNNAGTLVQPGRLSDELGKFLEDLREAREECFNNEAGRLKNRYLYYNRITQVTEDNIYQWLRNCLLSSVRDCDFVPERISGRSGTTPPGMSLLFRSSVFLQAIHYFVDSHFLGYTLLTAGDLLPSGLMDGLQIVGRRYVIPEEGCYYLPIKDVQAGYALPDNQVVDHNNEVFDQSLDVEETDLGDPFERSRKFIKYRYLDDRGMPLQGYMVIGSDQSLGISPTLATNYTIRTRSLRLWNDFLNTNMRHKLIGKIDGSSQEERSELLASLDQLSTTASAMVTSMGVEIEPIQFANQGGTLWGNFDNIIKRTIIDDTKLVLGSQVTSEVSSSLGNAEEEGRLLFRIVNDHILRLEAFINERFIPFLLSFDIPNNPYGILRGYYIRLRNRSEETIRLKSQPRPGSSGGQGGSSGGNAGGARESS